MTQTKIHDRFAYAAIEHLAVMVGFFDKNLVCHFANRAYREWFSKPDDEIVGRTILELMGFQRFAVVEPFVKEALGGKSLSFESEFEEPSGKLSYTSVQYLPEFNEKKELHGFFVIVDDITDRKTLETRAEEKALRFDKLFSGMSEGAILQDRSGKILEFNEAATKILGLSAEQLLGRTSYDPRWKACKPDGSPFPGEEHPSMVALATGHPQTHVPMIVIKPDGSELLISINAVPLFGKDAKDPSEVIVTFADLSELQRTSLELSAALRSAEELKLRQDIALEDSDIGVWEWDIQSNKLYWDKQMFRIYGVPKEKFSNAYDAWANGLHPDDSEKTQQIIKLAVEQGHPFKSYFRES